MFITTINCPNDFASSSVVGCEGFRKDGTLKNDCAICPAYQKYLKDKFPDIIIHAQTNI